MESLTLILAFLARAYQTLPEPAACTGLLSARIIPMFTQSQCRVYVPSHVFYMGNVEISVYNWDTNQTTVTSLPNPVHYYPMRLYANMSFTIKVSNAANCYTSNATLLFCTAETREVETCLFSPSGYALLVGEAVSLTHADLSVQALMRNRTLLISCLRQCFENALGSLVGVSSPYFPLSFDQPASRVTSTPLFWALRQGQSLTVVPPMHLLSESCLVEVTFCCLSTGVCSPPQRFPSRGTLLLATYNWSAEHCSHGYAKLTIANCYVEMLPLTIYSAIYYSASLQALLDPAIFVRESATDDDTLFIALDASHFKASDAGALVILFNADAQAAYGGNMGPWCTNYADVIAMSAKNASPIPPHQVATMWDFLLSHAQQSLVFTLEPFGGSLPVDLVSLPRLPAPLSVCAFRVAFGETPTSTSPANMTNDIVTLSSIRPIVVLEDYFLFTAVTFLFVSLLLSLAAVLCGRYAPWLQVQLEDTTIASASSMRTPTMALGQSCSLCCATPKYLYRLTDERGMFPYLPTPLEQIALTESDGSLRNIDAAAPGTVLCTTCYTRILHTLATNALDHPDNIVRMKNRAGGSRDRQCLSSAAVTSVTLSCPTEEGRARALRSAVPSVAVFEDGDITL